MIQKILHELGLSDKESKTYLALLEIGSAPASVLANRTGIRKSTTHFVCQELVKKRLFKVVQKKNTLIFTVENPERLTQIVEEKQAKFQVLQADLDQMMLKLKALQNPQASYPKVTFYEGLDGLRDFFTQMLAEFNSGQEIISFVKTLELSSQNQQIKKVVVDFLDKRVKKKIRTRVLCCEKNEFNSLKIGDREVLRETRLHHSSVLPDFSGGELFVYNNILASATEEHGLIMAFQVENKSISNLFRILFEGAWEQALS